jgi:predicted DNA-binding protein YlxM (UPF0122 family)
MVCSIFRYKTIYIEPNNILEVSISNFLYPFTFLFIILIYNNDNFKEAHKTIIKTAITFILFIFLVSILNSIPGNYYATETDLALKQVLTPNYFVINNFLVYYPNILNIISFTLLYYFSHVLILILYDYYGELLSEIQREYFEEYYFDNLSLSEISENLSVSRNAIHKSLKNIESLLFDYEDKLKIYYKTNKIEEIIKGSKVEDKVLEVLRSE